MVFGRSALDDFLTEVIPDEHYEPGFVHETLMTLPWSDVFTTNYDTLLERAGKKPMSASTILSSHLPTYRRKISPG